MNSIFNPACRKVGYISHYKCPEAENNFSECKVRLKVKVRMKEKVKVMVKVSPWVQCQLE